MISQHPRRAKPLPLDEEMYKWRHLIENFFGKLKEFKRIAMRACKTDQSFASMIHLVLSFCAGRRGASLARAPLKAGGPCVHRASNTGGLAVALLDTRWSF